MFHAMYIKNIWIDDERVEYTTNILMHAMIRKLK